MSRIAEEMVVAPEIADPARLRAAVGRAREFGVVLPTLSELANPPSQNLERVDPDEPRSDNLWRVNWYNGIDRRKRADVPGHIVLPEALTGVKAPIVVLLGCRFPMIGAHKVLPAYAGLAQRLATGRFDPAEHKAIWPSTGNYCRGGVAISRILGCRGVAVLPEGMSRERFDWLDKWVAGPADIIRTPGTESNVKEIYDKCAELEKDETNVILNQFSAFSNYMAHYTCTGAACERVFSHVNAGGKRRLAAFVAATGSAGTLAAGDHLKARHGTKIAAVEALECPTMLENGYGEHNIQGIGDKHIPLIQNVMNMDAVIAVSDRASDRLNLLFGSDAGRDYLVTRRKLDRDLVASFAEIGISGLANIVASIKLAKHLDLDGDHVVMTVATDSAEMYGSERDNYRAKHYPSGFDEVNAGEIFAGSLEAITDDHMLELGHQDRKRIFNLGYYTWVEQQGVRFEDFEKRKDQSFWRGLVDSIPAWDRLIENFNEAAGVSQSPMRKSVTA
ncbi:MAG: pyridoxal-phosphate dependent enzyme [Methylobacteriaceae bacterium]|nr:pyridoxal-phosphate dependent enzyme [Methylobacteriaceae bacterium]